MHIPDILCLIAVSLGHKMINQDVLGLAMAVQAAWAEGVGERQQLVGDLIDGIELGGAATFLEFAGEADVTLFI